MVELHHLGPVLPVGDGDAILAAQKMASELGLGIGISSGANILGAVQLQNALGDDAVVVTVLSDSNKKYLSTDLLRQEPVRSHYLSPHIQFIDYLPIKRLAI
jgi:cysteine synthase